MQERNAIQYHVSHARMPCNHAKSHKNTIHTTHANMQKLPKR